MINEGRIDPGEMDVSLRGKCSLVDVVGLEDVRGIDAGVFRSSDLDKRRGWSIVLECDIYLTPLE